MTYMLLLNCALKLVEEIILYYDARSNKHQVVVGNFIGNFEYTELRCSDVLKMRKDNE